MGSGNCASPSTTLGATSRTRRATATSPTISPDSAYAPHVPTATTSRGPSSASRIAVPAAAIVAPMPTWAAATSSPPSLARSPSPEERDERRELPGETRPPAGHRRAFRHLILPGSEPREPRGHLATMGPADYRGGSNDAVGAPRPLRRGAPRRRLHAGSVSEPVEARRSRHDEAAVISGRADARTRSARDLARRGERAGPCASAAQRRADEALRAIGAALDLPATGTCARAPRPPGRAGRGRAPRGRAPRRQRRLARGRGERDSAHGAPAPRRDRRRHRRRLLARRRPGAPAGERALRRPRRRHCGLRRLRGPRDRARRRGRRPRGRGRRRGRRLHGRLGRSVLDGWRWR